MNMNVFVLTILIIQHQYRRIQIAVNHKQDLGLKLRVKWSMKLWKVVFQFSGNLIQSQSITNAVSFIRIYSIFNWVSWNLKKITQSYSTAKYDDAIDPYTRWFFNPNDPTCTFGNLILNRGEQLATKANRQSRGQTECKCIMPPFISCFQYV